MKLLNVKTGACLAILGVVFLSTSCKDSAKTVSPPAHPAAVVAADTNPFQIVIPEAASVRELNYKGVQVGHLYQIEERSYQLVDGKQENLTLKKHLVEAVKLGKLQDFLKAQFRAHSVGEGEVQTPAIALTLNLGNGLQTASISNPTSFESELNQILDSKQQQPKAVKIPTH